MTYTVEFTGRGRSTLEDLEPVDRERIRRKLAAIASDRHREPRDWDFAVMEGPIDGRFRVGAGLRVFADVDDGSRTIRVHRVRRRENLYA